MLRCAALVGATASGKSSLAFSLAQQYQTSLIACDSMQVYQGLDIGTAKATTLEQSQVPHFLLNVVQLSQVFSAADWVRHSLAVIQSENDAGRTPLLVGGCGFYLRALLEGLSPIPAEKEQVREQVQQQWQAEGNAWLHQQVSLCDPNTAARLHEADSQRLLRALTVYQSSGTPLSVWQEKEPDKVEIHCPVFVLDMPREQLYTRINQRFDQMMAQGWLAETQWLKDQSLDESHPALRAVGYRQLLDRLQGTLNEQDAVTKGKTATRRYAKRQQTWFRHQIPTATVGSATDITQALKAVLYAKTT